MLSAPTKLNIFPKYRHGNSDSVSDFSRAKIDSNSSELAAMFLGLESKDLSARPTGSDKPSQTTISIGNETTAK